MPSELVGTTEALGASWKLTRMRFLTRVCSDVPGLVLETVKGFIAERTLVRAREIRPVLVAVHVHSHGRHGHGRSGHRIRR